MATYRLPSNTSPHPACNTEKKEDPGPLRESDLGAVHRGTPRRASQLCYLFSLPGHADFLGARTSEKENCLVLKGCPLQATGTASRLAP